MLFKVLPLPTAGATPSELLIQIPIPVQVHRACKHLVAHLLSERDPANSQEHCNW